MKSRINFLMMIFVPISTLVLVSKTVGLESAVFVVLLFAYALIYHPIISFNRLKAIGKLRNESFLKFYFSFYGLTYFEELYLTK